MAHMDPLPFDSVPEDIQERFAHYKETRGFTPNSIQTMARRPEIVRAFMQLNKVVLYEGTVAEELKMLVSLIASQAAGCRYCQAHMLETCREVYNCCRKKKSARSGSTRPATVFSEAERAALRLACHGAMAPKPGDPGALRRTLQAFR